MQSLIRPKDQSQHRTPMMPHDTPAVGTPPATVCDALKTRGSRRLGIAWRLAVWRALGHRNSSQPARATPGDVVLTCLVQFVEAETKLKSWGFEAAWDLAGVFVLLSCDVSIAGSERPVEFRMRMWFSTSALELGIVC